MPKRKKLTPREEIERLRMRRNDEVLGFVEQMFGFDRLRVRCKDGYTRTCRIRGKIRKRLWVRANDVVIVRPWIVQSEKKGDVMYRYTRTQVEWLRKKGIWE